MNELENLKTRNEELRNLIGEQDPRMYLLCKDLIRLCEAYREVAYQNSYQGVNISDKSVAKLVDDEAEKLYRNENT